MKLLGRLSRLLLKKAPWPQGTRPLDETHRVQHPRSKKGAAKRSLALKKSLACSQRQHAMTAFLLQHAKTPCCC